MIEWRVFYAGEFLGVLHATLEEIRRAQGHMRLVFDTARLAIELF